MLNIFFLLIFMILRFDVDPKDITTHEQTKIIEMTINSALKIDPGLNTNDFWIDFTQTDIFERQSINEFLKLHTNFTEINADSLIKYDSTWIKYGFLNKMLIHFNKVKIHGDSITIELDKNFATDGSNGIKVILKKINNYFKVVSAKMTWIS